MLFQKKSLKTLIALVALICCVAIQNAHAKDESWSTRCNDEEYCEMFIRMDSQQDDKVARLAEFAIGFPKELEIGRGVIILPLGILVQPGVGLSIDENGVYKFAINHCTTNGCIAFIDINDTVLDELKKGNVANFVFFAQNSKKFKIPVPLNGFTKAYKKARKSKGLFN